MGKDYDVMAPGGKKFTIHSDSDTEATSEQLQQAIIGYYKAEGLPAPWSKPAASKPTAPPLSLGGGTPDIGTGMGAIDTSLLGETVRRGGSIGTPATTNRAMSTGDTLRITRRSTTPAPRPKSAAKSTTNVASARKSPAIPSVPSLSLTADALPTSDESAFPTGLPSLSTVAPSLPPGIESLRLTNPTLYAQIVQEDKIRQSASDFEYNASVNDRQTNDAIGGIMSRAARGELGPTGAGLAAGAAGGAIASRFIPSPAAKAALGGLSALAGGYLYSMGQEGVANQLDPAQGNQGVLDAMQNPAAVQIGRRLPQLATVRPGVPTNAQDLLHSGINTGTALIPSLVNWGRTGQAPTAAEVGEAIAMGALTKPNALGRAIGNPAGELRAGASALRNGTGAQQWYGLPESSPWQAPAFGEFRGGAIDRSVQANELSPITRGLPVLDATAPQTAPVSATGTSFVPRIPDSSIEPLAKKIPLTPVGNTPESLVLRAPPVRVAHTPLLESRGERMGVPSGEIPRIPSLRETQARGVRGSDIDAQPDYQRFEAAMDASQTGRPMDPADLGFLNLIEQSPIGKVYFDRYMSKRPQIRATQTNESAPLPKLEVVRPGEKPAPARAAKRPLTELALTEQDVAKKKGLLSDKKGMAGVSEAERKIAQEALERDAIRAEQERECL